jgi:hypothetical protein
MITPSGVKNPFLRVLPVFLFVYSHHSRAIRITDHAVSDKKAFKGSLEELI